MRTVRDVARSNGLTLLEAVIASVLLGALVLAAYSFLGTTQNAYDDSLRETMIEGKAHRAVDEMASELRMADATTLSISQYRGSDRVEFRVPVKYTDEGVTWGPYVQYRFERSAVGGGESGRLVRVVDDSVKTVCDSLAPGTLRFQRTGNTLALELKLKGYDLKGRPIESRAKSSIAFRNRSNR